MQKTMFLNKNWLMHNIIEMRNGCHQRGPPGFEEKINILIFSTEREFVRKLHAES